MSRLSLLREERQRLTTEVLTVNERYPDGTPMPAAEATRIEAICSKIESIDREINAESAALKIAAGSDSWTFDGRDVNVLRNAADIRRHYGAMDNSRGGKISLADFVRGVAGMATTDAVRASLSTGTDSAGGHLLPSVVMPSVLEALVPASAVLSAGAGMIPVDVGAKSYTQAAIDTIPTAAWRLENGTVSESEPTFRAVAAVPRSLAFLFKVSRELLADAANVEQALILAIAQAFAKEVDRAALRGTGTAPEPRGVLNTSGIIAVANGANGASLATTKYANFFTALQQIMEANGPMTTAAIMSPRSRVVLGQLVDTTGQPLQLPDMLKPVNMLVTSQVPNALTVGSSSDCSEIYLGDFTRMALMFREQISIQKVDQLYAGTGQIGFICHVRADVMVQYPKAFAVVTGVRP